MPKSIHTLLVLVLLVPGLDACRSTPKNPSATSSAQQRASLSERSDAERTDAHVVAARRAAERADHQTAVRELRSAILLRPHSAQLHSDLAWSLAQLGQHDSALEAADEALRRSPSLAAAHYVRGWVLVSLERHRDAVESYRTALGIDATVADVHHEYGRTLALIARQEGDRAMLPEALEHVQSALRLGREAQKYKYYDELANILGGLGRFDESFAAMTDAVRLKPDDFKLWDNLAWQAMYGGRYEEAIRAFEEAERVEPGHLARYPEQRRCYEAVRARRQCTP